MSFSPDAIPAPIDPNVAEIKSSMTYRLASETDDSDLPSYQCEAYLRMLPMWTLVNDVYDGTDAIRAKATTYIPKFAIESDDAYQDRCARAVLMNVYARTVDAMVGLVIGSGLTIDDAAMPAVMTEHLKNINNAGTEFEVFARDVLRDAFNGHCVVLIDMPDLTEEEMPQYKSDPKAAAVRPYWTRWKPEDIVNFRISTIAGESVIDKITFKQCVTVPAGEFGEADEIHYLVWYLTTDDTGATVAAFEKWREREVETRYRNGRKKTDTEFEIIAGPTLTHMPRVPLFIVYGDQREDKILESRPPLLDLAHKNIEHLQIDSDYKKGLSIAGIAIPVLKTMKNEDEIEKIFGWDQVMCVGEDEEFDWKEANGAALPNKRMALEDIKREMAVLGLSLIAERADTNITATERVLDSVQQSNQLMAIQASLLQGLTQGLEIHAKWLKLTVPESGINIELGFDWTELVRAADNAQTLLELGKEDFLSSIALLKSLKAYGVLPDFIDPEKEVEALKKEGRSRVSKVDLKTAAPPPDNFDTSLSAEKTATESTSVKPGLGGQ